MRSDQYIGLNQRALNWLDANCKRITIHVKTTTSFEGKIISEMEHTFEDNLSDEYDHISGAWNENVGTLLCYKLKDDREAKEYVQEEPWSSGPMYFVALKIDGVPVPESLWTDEEVSLEEQVEFIDSIIEGEIIPEEETV